MNRGEKLLQEFAETGNAGVRQQLLDYIAMLEVKANWLGCLESAGVDNWDGCEHAYEMFEEE